MVGRRKQTKECSAQQLCMDNIPMGLNEFDNLSVSDSLEESLSTLLLFLS